MPLYRFASSHMACVPHVLRRTSNVQRSCLSDAVSLGAEFPSCSPPAFSFVFSASLHSPESLLWFLSPFHLIASPTLTTSSSSSLAVIDWFELSKEAVAMLVDRYCWDRDTSTAVTVEI
jgi:hypothetical protein